MVKLSELIRKGAGMVKGQCRNDFISKRKDGIYCCALGAAYLAATGKYPPYESAPNSGKVMAAIGRATGMDSYDILLLRVGNMNDENGMSFEDIARRLEEQGL